MAPLSRESSLTRPAAGDGRRPLEIVFSFDTTGSMNHCIAQVRQQVQTIMERLQADVPALRMAVFAHGDYCDASNYVTKWHDFSTDVSELCDFVRGVGGTGGGDFAECYELVLRQVREELSWTAGTQRSLVMIGDAIPHEPGYPQNTDKIDWKTEVDRLYNEMGVQIYAVQCNTNSQATEFFKAMADKTNGKHVTFEKFDTIVDILMSIVYREHGAEYFENYEKEVRAREGAGIRWELDRMLNRLADRPESSSSSPIAPPTPAVATVLPLRRTSTAKLGDSPLSASMAVTPVAAGKPKKPALRRIRDGPVRKRTPVSAKAKRASPKASPMKKTLLNLNTVKRVLRESKHDSHLMSWLQWTGWRRAFLPTEPSRNAKQWRQRPAPHTGFRSTDIFTDNNKPTIYEIAVQEADTTTMTPVWKGFTNGFQYRNWDTYFLRSPALRRFINDVLQKGCKLYVRRTQQFKRDDMFYSGVTATTLEEANRLISATYDYAWGGAIKSRQLFLRRSRRQSALVSPPSQLRRSKRNCVVSRRSAPY